MFLTRFNTIIHIFLSLGAFVNLQKEAISFIISVCPSVRLSFCPSALITCFLQNGSFKKFDISVFLENVTRKLKLHYFLAGMKGTLHEYQYTVLIISRSFLLRMRTVSGRSCRDYKTHIMC
jgi:hypothetical protein